MEEVCIASQKDRCILSRSETSGPGVWFPLGESERAISLQTYGILAMTSGFPHMEHKWKKQ